MSEPYPRPIFTLEGLGAPPTALQVSAVLQASGYAPERVPEAAQAVVDAWAGLRERLVHPKQHVGKDTAGAVLSRLLYGDHAATGADIRSWSAIAVMLIREQREARANGGRRRRRRSKDD